MYNNFSCGLQYLELMKDNIFELLESGQDIIVQSVKYQGAWFVLDDGNLDWEVLNAP